MHLQNFQLISQCLLIICFGVISPCVWPRCRFSLHCQGASIKGWQRSERGVCGSECHCGLVRARERKSNLRLGLFPYRLVFFRSFSSQWAAASGSTSWSIRGVQPLPKNNPRTVTIMRETWSWTLLQIFLCLPFSTKRERERERNEREKVFSLVAYFFLSDLRFTVLKIFHFKSNFHLNFCWCIILYCWENLVTGIWQNHGLYTMIDW